ncbi:MAG TPA: hypothetical protein VIB79_11025 [Candidatus Binatia bacterium]
MILYKYTVLLLLLVASAACGKAIEHDPTLAARRAVEFARAAFVRGDVDSAYALLAPSARGYVPLEKFKETLSRLHPSGRPSRVSAIEYEPMPGEKGIYIYLLGRDSGEEFEYTVTLEGTASTDYRVTKFTRGHPITSLVPSSSEKKRFPTPIE